MRTFIRSWLLLSLCTSCAWAYDLSKLSGTDYLIVWPSPSASVKHDVAMQIKMPTTVIPSEGKTYAQVVQEAMTTWNTQLNTVRFVGTVINTQINPPNDTHQTYENGNRVSEIVIDTTIDGDAFDSNTLAVTISYSGANIRDESDIVFNSSIIWNSYAGPLQPNIQDIRRVGLHELGHALGLKHPDLATPPQTVIALMNSTVSNTDALTTDDVTGAQIMYGAPGLSPGNNNFANAFTLTLAGGTASGTGTNVGASKESGEPNPFSSGSSGTPGGRSIWWKWTAAASGSATVSTFGSTFDSTLAIFTGGEVSNLAPIAGNDDEEPFVPPGPDSPTRKRTSKATFDAVGGTTYYFNVDGWDGEQGPVVITLTFSDVVTVPPGITSHPGNQTVIVGGTATFTAGANGTPAPTLQWQRLPAGSGTWSNLSNGGSYSGVTTGTLTVTSTTVGMHGDQFRCVATNSAGSATSNVANLSVNGGAAVMSGSAGDDHTLFLRADGALWGMGNTTSGQLGTNVSAGTLPVAVSTNVAAAVAAYKYSLFLKSDATLWGSGAGYFGNGSTPPKFPPVQVAASVAGMAAGSSHILYIKSDGTLWGVGANEHGQLGDGSGTQRLNAVQVAANVAFVAAGESHSLFIKSDGTLWGMGSDFGGKLGFAGNTSDRYSPELIATDVIAAAGGHDHSLFIKSGGTLWAMGVNSAGQLGDGTTTTRYSPVQIATGVVAVSAGFNHSLFIKSDGTLWGMGEDNGQLGTGAMGNRYTPVQIASGVVSASAGFAHSTYVKTDGTVWAMGYNASGQLGDGTTTVRYFPIQISNGIPTSPASPSGLTASDGTVSQSVRLSWNPTIGATKYEVWRSTTNSFGSATLVASNLTVSLFYDRTALPGTTYYYWIKAVNPAGGTLSLAPDTGIVAAGATDFNGDGKSDLLWQNRLTGERYVWMMNGTNLASSSYIASLPAEWSIATTGDFNADGKTDLVWQNTVTGDRYIYLMNGVDVLSGASLGNISTVWVIVAAADFNADGKTDLVWQNTSNGDRYVYFMNGTTFTSGASLGNVPLAWTIAGAADFNSDGQPDLLWQNTATGEEYVWLMNGTSFVSGVSLGTDYYLQLSGTGDYNSDGKPDILLSNMVTGERFVRLLNGTSVINTVSLGTLGLEWILNRPGQRRVPTDFNVDGRSDLVWQNFTTGERYIYLMNGTSLTSGQSLELGVSVQWTVVTTADFNADGKPDVVGENLTTGERVIWLMNANTVSSTVSLGIMPQNWTIAAAADMNQDGKPDLVWQDTNTGSRYLWLMNGTAFSAGQSLTLPVSAQWRIAATADFDGDGKADLVGENMTTGERAVWIMNNAAVTSTASLGTVPGPWVIANTIDLNADGHPDVIWQNTTTGERYIYLMNGTSFASAVYLTTVPTNWSICR